MGIFATLVSLKRLAENHYEAAFTRDQHTYTKRFTVIQKSGRETVSIDDADLDPRLHLSSDTRRALFTFHRAFREMNPVEKRSETYLTALYSPENLTRIEKEKANLLAQMLELSKKDPKPELQLPSEDIEKRDRERKKFIDDPGTDRDILNLPLA